MQFEMALGPIKKRDKGPLQLFLLLLFLRISTVHQNIFVSLA
jgi:hypothetical protein